MVKVVTGGTILALMSSTMCLREFRKSSHLKAEASKHEVKVEEVTEFNTSENTLGLRQFLSISSKKYCGLAFLTANWYLPKRLFGI